MGAAGNLGVYLSGELRGRDCKQELIALETQVLSLAAVSTSEALELRCSLQRVLWGSDVSSEKKVALAFADD
mgnify:FL=1